MADISPVALERPAVPTRQRVNYRIVALLASTALVGMLIVDQTVMPRALRFVETAHADGGTAGFGAAGGLDSLTGTGGDGGGGLCFFDGRGGGGARPPRGEGGGGGCFSPGGRGHAAAAEGDARR